VRRREILEYAARQGHGEVRVDVGEARHDHLAGSVDALGCGIARQDVGAGPDRGDAIGFDGDRGAVMDRVAIVDGGDRSIVNNDGQGFPLPISPITGCGVAECKRMPSPRRALQR
jgi:hypothetical protein